MACAQAGGAGKERELALADTAGIMKVVRTHEGDPFEVLKWKENHKSSPPARANPATGTGTATGDGVRPKLWDPEYSVASHLKRGTYLGPRYPTGFEPLDKLLTPF